MSITSEVLYSPGCRDLAQETPLQACPTRSVDSLVHYVDHLRGVAFSSGRCRDLAQEMPLQARPTRSVAVECVCCIV